MGKNINKADSIVLKLDPRFLDFIFLPSHSIVFCDSFTAGLTWVLLKCIFIVSTFSFWR